MAIKINHKDNSLQFKEVAAPITPPAGTAVLYVDSTSGTLTLKNDAGTAIAGVTNPMAANLDVGGFNIIGTPPATVTSDGGEVKLVGGEGGATSGIGAKVRITGGAANSTSNAGGVNITGGAAPSSGFGGTVLLVGGDSTSGTGGHVIISSGNGGSVGGDIELSPDGPGATTGNVHIRSNNTTAVSELQFYEARGTGSSYIGLKVPTALTNTVTWTLPIETHAEAAGTFLQAGALGALGVLSFTDTLGKDLSVGGFLLKQSASTYLDLNDTTTTLHTADTLAINSIGNTTIKPIVKAAAGSTTTLGAGNSSASTGGNLTLSGGNGTGAVGGDIILTPGTGSTAGIVDVTGDMEVTGNVVSHIDIVTDATASHPVVLTDDGKLIKMTSASANTVQIPAEGSIDFPIGTQILIAQEGAGQTTIAITTDALNSAGSLVLLASQYSTATIVKTASATWLLMGDLA